MSVPIPRRIRVDLMTPAELAIRDARIAVEAAGAHPLLTEAVVLLSAAQEKVADHVDMSARKCSACDGSGRAWSSHSPGIREPVLCKVCTGTGVEPLQHDDAGRPVPASNPITDEG